MYGYVKVGSAVPKLRVADCVYNKEEILKLVEAAAAKQVRVLSFPELSVTGYTCADLFFQAPLLHAAEHCRSNRSTEYLPPDWCAHRCG